jgi:hypothetical protein
MEAGAMNECPFLRGLKSLLTKGTCGGNCPAGNLPPAGHVVVAGLVVVSLVVLAGVLARRRRG